MTVEGQISENGGRDSGNKALERYDGRCSMAECASGLKVQLSYANQAAMQNGFARSEFFERRPP
jgi:hypothetical protein